MDKRFTWMHSNQLNAPQANGVKGSEGQMLNVLDAALVTGFNTQDVSSVSISGDTVTLTYAQGHGFELAQLIAISGAADVKLNGRHRVVSKTINTLQLKITGVSDTTGTITTKVAPLEFESIFGNTTPLKRAYRSSNLDGTRTVLYLDATNPTGSGYNTTNPSKRMMVNLCQNMTILGTQINSYTSTYNAYTKNKNGRLMWYQTRHYDKTYPVEEVGDRSWVIVGNGDIFYLFNEWQEYSVPINQGLRDIYAFGDIDGFDGVVDNYKCLWMGADRLNDEDGAYIATNGSEIGGDIVTTPRGYFIKPYNGVGTIEPMVMTSDGLSTAYRSGMVEVTNTIPLPNPASQSLVCFPLYALTTKGLRGALPRLMALPHNLSGKSTAYDLNVDNNILTIAVAAVANSSDNRLGFYAIDLGD